MMERRWGQGWRDAGLDEGERSRVGWRDRGVG